MPLKVHTTFVLKNRKFLWSYPCLSLNITYSDAATIPRHPRNLNSTVRREDTTRKEARERKKARKEEELLKKKEEVKRLKALKMKELKSKLERIGREGGWEDIEQNEGGHISSNFMDLRLASHSFPRIGPRRGLGPRFA
jgi:hypothetical protein